MRKVKSGLINLGDIKFIENSRIRRNEDVADLMSDITQRGLLQNIGIRISDNALIYGNRRVKAFEKLGFKEIAADFFDDCSDEDLLITNVVENIKRKQITSLEVGRICLILRDRGLSNTEIAARLGISKNRVEATITAYNVVKGTEFEDLVSYNNQGTDRKGIPESIIWKIQQNFFKVGKRKIESKEWKVLLNAVESNKLGHENISTLSGILNANPDMEISEALEILDSCKVIHLKLPVNRKELMRVMNAAKLDNPRDYLKILIRESNPRLLY